MLFKLNINPSALPFTFLVVSKTKIESKLTKYISPRCLNQRPHSVYKLATQYPSSLSASLCESVIVVRSLYYTKNTLICLGGKTLSV